SLPPGARLIAGRSQECDVRIDHASVSRRHLVVHGGPPPMVEDLGSANGTRAAGRELPPGDPIVLGPGMVVEVGSAMLTIRPAAAPTNMRATVPPTACAPPPDPGASSQQIGRLIELVAASSLAVILLGETGVGKDITAQRIHERSPRRQGPFVRLNCAAL